MSEVKNEQEIFWSGEFGNEYISRNKSDRLHASNLYLFSKIFDRTQGVDSISEFGCNIGMNLKAIRELSPVAELQRFQTLYTTTQTRSKYVQKLRSKHSPRRIFWRFL